MFAVVSFYPNLLDWVAKTVSEVFDQVDGWKTQDKKKQ